jgi:hypothetical protein
MALSFNAPAAVMTCCVGDGRAEEQEGVECEDADRVVRVRHRRVCRLLYRRLAGNHVKLRLRLSNRHGCGEHRSALCGL